MRKGSVLACLVIGVSLTAAGGCKPLYGNKPEKPYSPRQKREKAKPPEVVSEFKPIDDCQVSFHDPPLKGPTSQANLRASESAAQNAEAAMGQAAKATDDSSKLNYYKSAVESYRQALQKDPYNANVTLKLAVAYDSVLRKGCALALLRRIALMAANPRYSVGAGHAQDDVEQNTSMFAKYRSDAVAAVGR